MKNQCIKFISKSKTYKNTIYDDKPNEDFFISDDNNNIYILLDGVTVDRENGKYPNPSPACLASKIFAQKAYQYIKRNINNRNCILLIKESIRYANNAICLFNKKNTFPFSAGTVGIISIIRNMIFYYAYIGDCFGRLIRNNNITVFTEEQTLLVKKNKKNLTTYEIRNLICNNPDHPYKYGVYNGDKRALDLISCGEIKLSYSDKIILSSDGCEYVFQENHPDLNNIFDENKVIHVNNLDDRTATIIYCAEPLS